MKSHNPVRKAAPPFPVANFVQPARPGLGAPDEIQSVFRSLPARPAQIPYRKRVRCLTDKDCAFHE
jgi:hypothetical protein